MGELLAGLNIGDVGFAGLLAITVLLILTGRLVTRAQLNDVQADRDHWRTAADRWQDVASKHGMTLERLLTFAESSDHALSEIQAGLQRSENNP